MGSRSRKAVFFLLGLGAVAALATVVFRDQVQRHRKELFSHNPFRRLAALRHMAGEDATIDAITVLRDFVQWEPRRLLRSQAMGVLVRMERDLKQQVLGP